MSTTQKYSDPGQSWKVTQVTPKVDVSGGSPITGHEVAFITDTGARSTVFIPDSVTSIDQAKEMIAGRAQFVSGLSSLSG